MVERTTPYVAFLVYLHSIETVIGHQSAIAWMGLKRTKFLTIIAEQSAPGREP